MQKTGLLIFMILGIYWFYNFIDVHIKYSHLLNQKEESNKIQKTIFEKSTHLYDYICTCLYGFRIVQFKSTQVTLVYSSNVCNKNSIIYH